MGQSKRTTMPEFDLDSLLASLSTHHLLEDRQLEESRRLGLYADYQTPQLLVKALVERSWLTPYQAERILQGQTQELSFGTYILLEPLGQGGMGMVFKARHRNLDRLVAIKFIRKEALTGARAIQRFYQEARAAARLAHPNIVSVYDADEVNGMHFIAMEYVEGSDLARLLKRHGPMPVGQACDYVRQLALGLQHAHERGLVHRDIKPGNIMVCQAPAGQAGEGGEVVKILDMGLARLDRGDPAEEGTPLTHAGAMMGTPDFMAPEQALDAHDVDIRADLYSVGCTLYQLLTGQVPFPGGNVLSKLDRHRKEPPKPIGAFLPQIIPEVERIVARLLAKQPAERYQTPAELVAALEQLILPDDQVSAQPSTLDQDGLSAKKSAAAGDVTGLVEVSEFVRREVADNALETQSGPGPQPGPTGATIASTAYSAPAPLPSGRPLASARPAAAVLPPPVSSGPETFQSQAPVGVQARQTTVAPASSTPVVAPPPPRRRGLLLLALLLFASLGIGLAWQTLGTGPRQLPASAVLATLTGAVAAVPTQPAPTLRQVEAVAIAPKPPEIKPALPTVRTGVIAQIQAPYRLKQAVFDRAGQRVLCLCDSTSAFRLLRCFDLGLPDPENSRLGLEGGRAIEACTLAPNGLWAVFASTEDDENQADLHKILAGWSLEPGRRPLVQRLPPKDPAQDSSFSALVFSPRGDRVLSASADGLLRLWTHDNGKLIERTAGWPQRHKATGLVLAFPPDGTLALSAGRDGLVRLWNVETGTEKGVSFKHDHFVTHICAAAGDSGRALSVDADNTLYRWNLNDPAQALQKLALGKDKMVRSLAFNATGTRFLSGGDDGKVRLWDYASLTVLESFDDHLSSSVLAVAFSADGAQALSAGTDNTIRRWKLSGR